MNNMIDDTYFPCIGSNPTQYVISQIIFFHKYIVNINGEILYTMGYYCAMVPPMCYTATNVLCCYQCAIVLPMWYGATIVLWSCQCAILLPMIHDTFLCLIQYICYHVRNLIFIVLLYAINIKTIDSADSKHVDYMMYVWCWQIYHFLIKI